MRRKAPKTGAVCYCPMCHQFGKPARGCPVEGKTRRTKTPIVVCTQCATRPVKETKYLPDQKMFEGF